MGKKLFQLFKVAIRGFLDIIYERESLCILCKKNQAEDVICESCLKNISTCTYSDMAYGYYHGELKRLIFLFKFKKDFSAGRYLAKLLSEKIRENYNDYYITYIPMSSEKFKKRGFNHCRYLAFELSYICNIEVLNLLELNKEVKVQKTLTKKERQKNMNNAFKIRKQGKAKGMNIIIVDDICTTGATLNEAYRVLMNDGANKIKCLVIAKANL